MTATEFVQSKNRFGVAPTKRGGRASFVKINVALAERERAELTSTWSFLHRQYQISYATAIQKPLGIFQICSRWAEAARSGALSNLQLSHLANLTRFLIDLNHQFPIIHLWRATSYYQRGEKSLAADILLHAPQVVARDFAEEIIAILREVGREAEVVMLMPGPGRRRRAERPAPPQTEARGSLKDGSAD